MPSGKKCLFLQLTPPGIYSPLTLMGITGGIPWASLTRIWSNKISSSIDPPLFLSLLSPLFPFISPTISPLPLHRDNWLTSQP